MLLAHHTTLPSPSMCSGLRDALAGEAQAREEADCVVLDAMLEAQKRLQVIRWIGLLWGGGGGGGAW